MIVQQYQVYHLGETFAVAGGEGVDATISGQTLTIAGELTAQIKVSIFSSDNFTVRLRSGNSNSD